MTGVALYLQNELGQTTFIPPGTAPVQTVSAALSRFSAGMPVLVFMCVILLLLCMVKVIKETCSVVRKGCQVQEVVQWGFKVHGTQAAR